MAEQTRTEHDLSISLLIHNIIIHNCVKVKNTYYILHKYLHYEYMTKESI